MFPALRERMNRAKDYSIPYDTFIQYALYDQDHGYYNLSRTKVGKEGDYYTSSHIHKVFSQVMAKYFISVHQSLQIPLHICEIGSGDGKFAEGVCQFFEDQGVSYTYDTVEISSEHREKTNRTLIDKGDVNMFESLDDWHTAREGFKGVIFSNEWLDAQPVKIVTKQNGELFEVFVCLQEDDTLQEMVRTCSASIVEWLSHFNYKIEEGQRIEIPIYMEKLYQKINRTLDKGLLINIDYGYTHQELLHPARQSGSIRGYLHHQMKDNVLCCPGKMDITHHVHWDTWMRIGDQFGFQSRLLKQRDFLLEANILGFLTQSTSQDPFSEEHKQNRAIRSFIMGDQMSNAFEVCVQTKGVEFPYTEKPTP